MCRAKRGLDFIYKRYYERQYYESTYFCMCKYLEVQHNIEVLYANVFWAYEMKQLVSPVKGGELEFPNLVVQ